MPNRDKSRLQPAQEQALAHVEIYTDGGCDPNPGPGGWGAVLLCGPHLKELSGAELQTTNNRMELQAAIAALAALQQCCDVVLYTDSKYVHQGMTLWLPRWRENNWRKVDGTPVENLDLWQELLQQVGRQRIVWQWLKGHRGHPHNERADRLATMARAALLRGESPAAVGRPDGKALKAPERTEEMPERRMVLAACSLGAPGPSGYAAILVGPDERTEVVSGRWPLATANAMELWAAVAGLRTLKQRSRVKVLTASKYVLQGATEWLKQWESRGWRTRDSKPIKNQEMWAELARVMGDHDLSWEFLDRHHRDAYAEHAATVARREAQTMMQKQGLAQEKASPAP